MHPRNEKADGYLALRIPKRLIKAVDQDAKHQSSRSNKITRSSLVYQLLCREYGYPGENA